MKKVYKCPYCDFTSDNKLSVHRHIYSRSDKQHGKFNKAPSDYRYEDIPEIVIDDNGNITNPEISANITPEPKVNTEPEQAEPVSVVENKVSSMGGDNIRTVGEKIDESVETSNNIPSEPKYDIPKPDELEMFVQKLGSRPKLSDEIAELRKIIEKQSNEIAELKRKLEIHKSVILKILTELGVE